jgi:hypothetical protein
MFSLPVFGQVNDIESLMTRRELSCNDIFYNISSLIPEFYEKGSKDTLQAIMAYWEEKCGVSEVFVRCKILLSIDDGSFNESIYDNDILRILRKYQHSIKCGGKNRYDYRFDNFYSDHLNEFTAKLSKTFLETKKLTAVEKFFLRIYANDPDQTIYQMLDSDELSETRIKELYVEEKRSGYLHSVWMLGIWLPQEHLHILGVHPYLGYKLGIKYPKLTVDLSFGVKFGNTPNTYQVYKEDKIWNTKYFLGWYVGMDTGYELFRLWNNSIDMIGGIGWDGFESLNEKNEKMTKTLHSLNLNIGLGYKFYFKNRRYVGIDFKYNFVNFKNPHGTNLGGNTYTVNLIFGNVISELYHFM